MEAGDLECWNRIPAGTLFFCKRLKTYYVKIDTWRAIPVGRPLADGSLLWSACSEGPRVSMADPARDKVMIAFGLTGEETGEQFRKIVIRAATANGRLDGLLPGIRIQRLQGLT